MYSVSCTEVPGAEQLDTGVLAILSDLCSVWDSEELCPVGWVMGALMTGLSMCQAKASQKRFSLL